MASDPTWLGIDLGTQSVKVVAVDSNGDIQASASAPIRSTRHGGIHEQDPQEWWEATAQCLRAVTSRVSAQSIAAVATCATSGTLVIGDAITGDTSSPASMYDDSRAQSLAPKAQEVGSALWPRLGFSIQGSWGLPRMMEAVQRGAIGSGQVFLTQADYINSRLAGKRVASDTSHTLKFGLDLDEARWPLEILLELGIPSEFLNEVATPGMLIGEVTKATSTTTGIPDGTPIVAGMTDGSAAQIAAGCVSPGQWNSVLGTTLVVKGASDVRHHDSAGALYCHRAPFDGGWWPGGASSTGASAVSTFFPDVPTEQLVVDNNLPETVGVLYPLTGTGERFPFVRADAHGFRVDSTPPGRNPAASFTEVALGIALVERLSFDVVRMAGYAIEGPIRLTGGGARNQGWNQLRSSVMGREVLIPANTETAHGMAILAAAAIENPTPVGLDETAARMSAVSYRLSPEEGLQNRVAEAYGKFLGELEHREWIESDLVNFAKGGIKS
ncbi:MAG: hypothetical protein RL247_780 [Actinomycetota bacterium]|jgi:sugar (pentulose or hexulose) kinase